MWKEEEEGERKKERKKRARRRRAGVFHLYFYVLKSMLNPFETIYSRYEDDNNDEKKTNMHNLLCGVILACSARPAPATCFKMRAFLRYTSEAPLGFGCRNVPSLSLSRPLFLLLTWETGIWPIKSYLQLSCSADCALLPVLAVCNGSPWWSSHTSRVRWIPINTNFVVVFTVSAARPMTKLNMRHPHNQFCILYLNNWIMCFSFYFFAIIGTSQRDMHQLWLWRYSNINFDPNAGKASLSSYLMRSWTARKTCRTTLFACLFCGVIIIVIAVFIIIITTIILIVFYD